MLEMLEMLDTLHLHMRLQGMQKMRETHIQRTDGSLLAGHYGSKSNPHLYAQIFTLIAFRWFAEQIAQRLDNKADGCSCVIT